MYFNVATTFIIYFKHFTDLFFRNLYLISFYDIYINKSLENIVDLKV